MLSSSQGKEANELVAALLHSAALSLRFSLLPHLFCIFILQLIHSFRDHADSIIAAAKGWPTSKIESSLKVNGAIAGDARSNYEDWTPNMRSVEDSAKFLPCFHAFDGFAYKKVNGRDFTDEQMAYAGQHVRVLDPVYGILRGTDVIQRYRMELTAKVAVNEAKEANLSSFWKPKVTESLKEEFGDEGGLLFDAASKEYSDLVGFRAAKKGEVAASTIPHVTLVTLRFMRGSGGAPAMIAKQGRGAFVRYFCEAKVKTVEDAKSFDLDGWTFREVVEKGKGIELVFWKPAKEEGENSGKTQKKRKKSASE